MRLQRKTSSPRSSPRPAKVIEKLAKFGSAKGEQRPEGDDNTSPAFSTGRRRGLRNCESVAAGKIRDAGEWPGRNVLVALVKD
jgi:hypothetical protein